MINKIISGCQYGADLAGLMVARDLGIKTGGMAPLGFKTKFGNRPQLAKLGIIEHTSADYKPRTYANVKNSDATIRFAYDFKSAGEWCTLKAIHKYKKPHFDVDLSLVEDGFNFYWLDVAEFFYKHDVCVLNVAGNCGHNKAYAKKIYNLTRKALTTYINLYHEHYKLKETWGINDIKG